MLRPVVFDVDEVLAGFREGYRNLAIRLGRPEIPALTGKWDDYLDDAVWRAIKDPSSGFWARLSPLIGCETFDRIGDMSYDRPVYMATSRPGEAAFDETRDWLDSYGLGRCQLVINSKRAEFCSAVNAEWLIDDKAGNAVATAYMAPRTVPVILDRPWNTFPHDNIGSRVVRLPSVERFLDLVEKGSER